MQVPLSFAADMLLNRLLYRDGLILIIDKPAGLPVHAGPKGGETLEHYLDALRFGLPGLPQLGHRLDRDTSGCLALGRHKKGIRRLGRLFQSGLVKKTYWAIVEGKLPEVQGRIDVPLAKKNTSHNGWWMQVDSHGKPAITDYRIIASNHGLSLVELRPQTGRTHQLRVHLAYIGCPIRGDVLYGGTSANGLMLHARAIDLPLHENKPVIHAEAEPPLAFRSMMAAIDSIE